LARRGEQVFYYATEPFREKIERAGATFRCYGAHELFERNLASGGMLGGMAGLIATTQEMMPGLLEQLRSDRPDYLLSEAHAVWGNLTAQVLGVPTATLCAMFAINESLIQSPELMGHLYGAAPREAVFDGLLGLSRYFVTSRELSKRHGVRCPGIVDYLGNRQALNVVFTSREFQIGGGVFDDSYQFVGPSIDERRDPAGLPLDELGHQPLIYISMGTMYNDEAGLYRASYEAFGGADFRVVLAVGHRVDRSKLPEPPPNFLVREYVSQLAVLELADLFITHGGINSAHEAMLQGVPMVVLPQAADHHVVAQQVEAVGAGIVLDRSKVTARGLRELTGRVLRDPAYRDRSKRMGESLRGAGGYRRAADEILAFKQRCGI
jgi:MGT family glycosyltransferase